MRKAPPLFLLLCRALLAAQEGENQEKDFQRYDLVREESELTVEGSLHYAISAVNGEDYYAFTPGLNVEYTVAKRHTAGFSLPYSLSFYESPGARQRVFYALGDLRLSYEYLLQKGHINWFFTPLLSIPLSTVNEYAQRAGVLRGGAGRFLAGAEVSVTGIMDPVVWNAGFQYLVGLPKEERFSTSWQPGNMRFSAGLSDLINERFGGSLGLYQSLNLPQIAGGVWDKRGLAVSTLLRLEGFILFEHDYVRLQADYYAYPAQQPLTLGVVYGHQFILKKKPQGTTASPP